MSISGIKINEGILNGVDRDTADEIISFINRLTPAQAAQVTKVMANVAQGRNATSRDKMISRLFQLRDQTIINGILSGEIMAKDFEIFKSVSIDGLTNITEIFQQSDTVLIGVTNVNKGRLDPGQFMLVDRIALNYSETATLNIADWTTDIADVAANGYIEIKQSGKMLTPKYLPNKVFTNKQKTDSNKGEYELDTPFWIVPDEFIEANYYGTAVGTTNAKIRLALRGSILIPR